MIKLEEDGSIPDCIQLLSIEEVQRQLKGNDACSEAITALPATKKSTKTRVKRVPAMPVLPPRPYVDVDVNVYENRSQGGGDSSRRFELPLAMVARLIPSKEIDKTVGGRAAVEKEWNALLDRECWNIDNAKEWDEVRKEANKAGKIIHLGAMLELLYQKR